MVISVRILNFASKLSDNFPTDLYLCIHYTNGRQSILGYIVNKKISQCSTLYSVTLTLAPNAYIIWMPLNFFNNLISIVKFWFTGHRLTGHSFSSFSTKTIIVLYF